MVWPDGVRPCATRAVRASRAEPNGGDNHDRRLLALDLSNQGSQERFDLVHLVRLGFETD
jgi:hypothetical protein